MNRSEQIIELCEGKKSPKGFTKVQIGKGNGEVVWKEGSYEIRQDKGLFVIFKDGKEIWDKESLEDAKKYVERDKGK